MGFFINTEIRDWIKNDPNRLVTQAHILVSEHPRLDHDSFVDCWEIIEFDESELDQPRDPVSKTAKLSIKAAVGKSKTIEKTHRLAIRDS